MSFDPSGFPEGFHPDRLILSGIETEYGFSIPGRGAAHQADDAVTFVRTITDSSFLGWNYRHESPRRDLRGFSAKSLAVDPEDAQFDRGRDSQSPEDIRSDRVLLNGGRFYNDHGHPEFSTPECFSPSQVVLHDKAGEILLLRAAARMSEKIGAPVSVFKNNTDFHGASYGTHESCLIPRCLEFPDLYQALMPMLIARMVLTGAGKAGSESGPKCDFQMSARADFFTEAASVDTLYRRPVVNTRDEPHADPRLWQRVHIISGDANMIPSCCQRKLELVHLALALALRGNGPVWKIDRPAEAAQSLSRSCSPSGRIALAGGSWTTAEEILESYFTAWENRDSIPEPEARPDLPASADYSPLIQECRTLLESLRTDQKEAIRKIDWAAKREMLRMAIEEDGLAWDDPSLQAYDLAYHNIDPEEGLYFAMAEMGLAEPYPSFEDRLEALTAPKERTRAWVRGLAVQKWRRELASACWKSLTFSQADGKHLEIDLDPYKLYDVHLGECSNVGNFISCIRS